MLRNHAGPGVRPLEATEDAMTTEFTIEIPQTDIDDLHERLARVRWPAEVPGVGSTRGIGADRLRELALDWRTGFGWRAQDARLYHLAHTQEWEWGGPVPVPRGFAALRI